MLGCSFPPRVHGANSADRGDQLNGAYNLVRFLHLHDQQKTIVRVVARVPLQPADLGRSTSMSHRRTTEVAMMEYIEADTNILIPYIIYYSADFSGSGVRLPYILISKVDGAPLSSVWNIGSEKLCSR